MRRLVSVVILVAVTLAGCGEDGISQGEARASVRRSGSATLAAKTARISLKTDSSNPDAMAAEIDSSGVIDFERKAGTFTLASQALGGPGGSAEVRVLGSVVYLAIPAGTVPTDKAWLKIDLTDESLPEGFNTLGQLGAGDPTAALAFLEGVSGEVKVVGESKVGGARVTHYRTIVDMVKAAKTAGPNAKRLLDQTVAAGIRRIPADLWIDAAGRLRRVRQRFDFAKATDPAAREAGVITTTMEYSDFGTKVDVVAPPDGETISYAELQKLAAT